jgi:hypothetical protein
MPHTACDTVLVTAVMGTVRLMPGIQRAARTLQAPTQANPTDLPEPPGEPAPLCLQVCMHESAAK